MRILSRVIMLVAALAVGLGLASPAQAASSKTVKLVVTSQSGSRIYLEHHMADCKYYDDCKSSAKDGTSKVAKYTQVMKIRRNHSVWITTTALKRHRVKLYVNGKLVYDKKAKWQPQDDAGFFVTDHIRFIR